MVLFELLKIRIQVAIKLFILRGTESFFNRGTRLGSVYPAEYPELHLFKVIHEKWVGEPNFIVFDYAFEGFQRCVVCEENRLRFEFMLKGLEVLD